MSPHPVKFRVPNPLYLLSSSLNIHGLEKQWKLTQVLWAPRVCGRTTWNCGSQLQGSASPATAVIWGNEIYPKDPPAPSRILLVPHVQQGVWSRWLNLEFVFSVGLFIKIRAYKPELFQVLKWSCWLSFIVYQWPITSSPSKIIIQKNVLVLLFHFYQGRNQSQEKLGNVTKWLQLSASIQTLKVVPGSVRGGACCGDPPWMLVPRFPPALAIASYC